MILRKRRKTTKRKVVKKKPVRKTTKKKTTKRKVAKKKVKKKRKASKNAFGGYRIIPDEKLAAVLGTKRAVKPSEMTKLLWKYIKKNKLANN